MEAQNMYYFIILLALSLSACATLVSAFDQGPGPSHGITYPKGWQEWSTIAVSHRTDNNTLRVILGNDEAVKADGAILGKVVWKDTELENWKEAIAPGTFVHAEFMFKNSKKYTQSYGWGWARWVGLEQKPFDKGMQVCTTCHTPVKGRDWVFTDPAVFPK
jgi:hypothetical protein